MLAGGDVPEWVALRQVRSGGVARVGGCWMESGHRLPDHLALALGGLLAHGLIRLVNTVIILGRRFIDDDPDPLTISGTTL